MAFVHNWLLENPIRQLSQWISEFDFSFPQWNWQWPTFDFDWNSMGVSTGEEGIFLLIVVILVVLVIYVLGSDG